MLVLIMQRICEAKSPLTLQFFKRKLPKIVLYIFPGSPIVETLMWRKTELFVD
jgi:hypothetical protein